MSAMLALLQQELYFDAHTQPVVGYRICPTHTVLKHNSATKNIHTLHVVAAEAWTCDSTSSSYNSLDTEPKTTFRSKITLDAQITLEIGWTNGIAAKVLVTKSLNKRCMLGSDYTIYAIIAIGTWTLQEHSAA